MLRVRIPVDYDWTLCHLAGQYAAAVGVGVDAILDVACRPEQRAAWLAGWRTERGQRDGLAQRRVA